MKKKISTLITVLLIALLSSCGARLHTPDTSYITPSPTPILTPAPVTPSPAPLPTETPPSSITVYRTKTGKCYHKDGCYYLKSKIPLTLEKVRQTSLRPCYGCNPPE